MKRAALVLAVLCPALVLGLALVQVTEPPNLPAERSEGLSVRSKLQTPGQPLLATVVPQASFAAFATPQTLDPFGSSNFVTVPDVIFALNSPANPAAPISPGVYQTVPYSCLVLVPEPQLDDKCIVGGRGGETDPHMPMVRPDMQLIPRKP